MKVKHIDTQFVDSLHQKQTKRQKYFGSWQLIVKHPSSVSDSLLEAVATADQMKWIELVDFSGFEHLG